MSSSSVDYRICVTCRNWGGYRKTDACKMWIEYDNNEEGYCANWQSDKTADNTCSGWEPLYRS